MLEELLTGKPSVYDVSSFIAIVVLLCVCLGMHLRQIKHNRMITKINTALGITADKQS